MSHPSKLPREEIRMGQQIGMVVPKGAPKDLVDVSIPK